MDTPTVFTYSGGTAATASECESNCLSMQLDSKATDLMPLAVGITKQDICLCGLFPVITEPFGQYNV